MFKFVIFSLLLVVPTVHAFTKEELPNDMQECIDNVIIPRKRFHDALDKKCVSSGATGYDEYSKCIQPAYDKFDSQENINCLVIQHDLPKEQSVFVELYIRKLLYNDDYSRLPENFRECLGNVQPELREYFDLIQECEPFFNLRDPKQSDEYKECHKNNQEVKLAAFKLTPEFKKCMELSNSISGPEHSLMESYMFKVAYNQ